MKSKIILDEEEKEEYTILFKLETNDKNLNYVVYTKNEVDKNGEVIAYAAIYKKEKGKQILEPIKDDYTLEFLDSILIEVQNKMNKEG